MNTVKPWAAASAAARDAGVAETHPLPDVLVVDLDGTLIRTDMLFETFWAALSQRWTSIVGVLGALPEGRAHLKRTLSGLGAVDVAALPYNDDVVAYARRWREAGGRVVLVSAADQRIVDSVAAHLGLFDAAHGSDGQTNLKGARKAAFLSERFPEGFAYFGDRDADYPIWQRATRAITVDVPQSLRARVDALPVPAEHLTTRGSPLRPLFRAIRPQQWLKNVLVFLPLLVAHRFTLPAIGEAALAFVVFSLVASSVYVLNDLLDLEADRAHPRKRERPFASGALPLSWGTALAPGLLLAGGLLSLPLGPEFLGVIVVYYLVTTAYSFVLKRRLVVDICALAALYTLRIIAGGVATGIPLSVWLLAFSMFFFFSLAAMKRKTELVSSVEEGAEVAPGRGYMTDDLPLVSNMAVASGYVSVLVMALYINSPAVTVLYSATAPLWGICLILLYWLSRMMMLAHRGQMHDDPVVFAAKDRVSLLCGGLIFALVLSGMLL
ncbi:UbiA family prenyltransferase [Lutimaribacter sp. EGI FJ00015]|uniref:UbiA family prenyltransferase n=1 Tax=Lutimaribacter degradans TaxID=2945989 RepID=A0ACC5ZW69_9RHOB|nr:UbiA family prenyltransferase [Lutimaribacter sp. EGI FJ00013]MCM2562317.1 UbiA family prenyltransferase [Lutimaribacter sp. EGI FJ00013]MCO0613472.1 UbiA family prenyltransferase [Lutimaribacter sp. EGI FJ00015]MCO0636446.1 UbiA family prenyltransferase [Lutimaribacter sp. EGI FJ00014]